jgi:hypothetical protein
VLVRNGLTLITGCLEMEKEFSLENYADDCVKQTVGWNYSWINDRPIVQTVQVPRCN